jgi:hypothetical protein
MIQAAAGVGFTLDFALALSLSLTHVKGAPLIFIFILTHDIFTHDILTPQQ